MQLWSFKGWLTLSLANELASYTWRYRQARVAFKTCHENFLSCPKFCFQEYENHAYFLLIYTIQHQYLFVWFRIFYMLLSYFVFNWAHNKLVTLLHRQSLKVFFLYLLCWIRKSCHQVQVLTHIHIRIQFPIRFYFIPRNLIWYDSL